MTNKAEREIIRAIIEKREKIVKQLVGPHYPEAGVDALFERGADGSIYKGLIFSAEGGHQYMPGEMGRISPSEFAKYHVPPEILPLG